MAVEKKYCPTCQRMLDVKSFYSSHNLDAFPDGKLRECKKCRTMFIDNFDPDTYVPILEECDVPYIPEEWDKVLISYQNEPDKLTGMTILGRYLSKMKLSQWKTYRWKDTEIIRQEKEEQRKNYMKKNGYTDEEIEEELAKQQETIELNKEKMTSIKQNADEYIAKKTAEEVAAKGDNEPGASQSTLLANPYFEDDLTEEDRKYLSIKWGNYSPQEWVQLEQLFNDMMDSYDIQAAGHVDTLKLVCKASLKTNQLLDIGDLDGASKASRMYDSLMKSGKFTAAQNKAESGEFVDSIGELVAVCEKEGYIERYYVDEPKDKVDEVLKDLESYTNRLVRDELNLGNLIENALKSMKDTEAREEDEDDDDLFSEFEEEDNEGYLSDEDLMDFQNFIEEQEKKSAAGEE